MSTLPVTTVVERAEEAFREGRYDAASRLCEAVLETFPRYLRALRLLGRAALAAGDLERAESAFHGVLRLDPEDREAAVGLSRIAERRGALETALAYCQAAWEMSPWDRDLRAEVGRLAETCYGEGQLFLTSAALAAQHSRGGRWTRAATECRTALGEVASRVDIRQRLAVALWRRGDREAAAEICRSILDELPDAVVPLLLLAEIEQQRGEVAEAAALLARAHAVDVDGERAASLTLPGEDDLLRAWQPATVPVVDEAVLAVEGTLPEPVPPPVEAVSDREVEPTAPAPREVAAPATEDVVFELPSDEELAAARPEEVMPRGYTSILGSLEEEGLEPFSPVGESPAEPAGSAEDALLQLPSDEELEAARPRGDLDPGWTGLLESFEIEGIEPFSPEDFGGGGAAPSEERAWSDTAVPAETSEGGEPVHGRPESIETGSWLDHVLIGEETPGEAPPRTPRWEEQVAPAADGDEDVAGVVRGLSEPAEAVSEGETGGAPPGAEVAPEDELAAAAERLGVGPALFDRSRAAKEELVATGMLRPEAEAAGTPEPETITGVEAGDPLAEARQLWAAGQVEEAMRRYRALYRAGQQYDEALIAELTPIADSGGPGAVEADRILGAIYRRRGTQTLAARHYERSLRRARRS